MVNKQEVIKAFIKQLEEDLLMMKAAAMASREAATNEESKPENEYDTRGLEASYIAGAQAKRAGEIDEVLSLFKTLPIQSFKDSDAISATALVQVEMNDQKKNFLVFPRGGGVQVKWGEELIQIITPSSTMGQALLGLSVGDTAEFENAGRSFECEILKVQ